MAQVTAQDRARVRKLGELVRQHSPGSAESWGHVTARAVEAFMRAGQRPGTALDIIEHHVMADVVTSRTGYPVYPPAEIVDALFPKQGQRQRARREPTGGQRAYGTTTQRAPAEERKPSIKLMNFLGYALMAWFVIQAIKHI
jgi:hypothetical protein